MGGTEKQATQAKALIEELIGNRSPAHAAKSALAPKEDPDPSNESVTSRRATSSNVESDSADTVPQSQREETPVAKAKPAKGSVHEAGVVVKTRSRSPRRVASKADPLKDWLQGLDESGDMLRYLDLLRKNFSSLSQLSH